MFFNWEGFGPEKGQFNGDDDDDDSDDITTNLYIYIYIFSDHYYQTNSGRFYNAVYHRQG